MEPLRLEDVESTTEVAEAAAAIRDGRAGRDWVKPFSANGKHSTLVRRDPARLTDS